MNINSPNLSRFHDNGSVEFEGRVLVWGGLVVLFIDFVPVGFLEAKRRSRVVSVVGLLLGDPNCNGAQLPSNRKAVNGDVIHWKQVLALYGEHDSASRKKHSGELRVRSGDE